MRQVSEDSELSGSFSRVLTRRNTAVTFSARRNPKLCDGAPLQRDRPTPQHNHLATNANATVGPDVQKQRRRTPRVLALRDLQFLRQRPTHREKPPAEVRCCRAGGGVLDHRPTLRKEESRQQPSRCLQGCEQIRHSLAPSARKAR